MRRLTATAALLAAAFLVSVLGVGPALAVCPAPPAGQSPAPCDELGAGRGSGDIPVPLPVIDPVPTTTTATPAPAPGATLTTRAGTRISPVTRNATTGRPADVVGATPGLPFTGPRTVTLVVVAGVLAAIGLGSLLSGRHQARH